MRRFLLRILLYLLPLLAAVGYYCFCVDPEALRGDLGRMTQLEFKYEKPAADTTIPRSECRDVEIEDIEPLAENEVVVFGDSFSAKNDRIWAGCRWHQYLGGAIRKNIVNIRTHSECPVNRYLTTLTLRPDLLGDTVILECIERYLINRLCSLDFEHTPDHLPDHPKETTASWFEDCRKTMHKPVQYYQRRLGIDVPVSSVKLNQPFFSTRPNTLYFFDEDIIPRSEKEIATAFANLCRLDSLSRAKGITLVVVAIPDKYTVYHHYFIKPDNTKRVLESPCRFDSLPRFINLLPTLSKLVEAGIKDVYLPDDTHFSTIGTKATGLYVAEHWCMVAKESEK